MRKDSIPELDKLFNDIETYRGSERLKELYDFIKKFPEIAPYNAMLIYVQKPGSQFVASAREWKLRFNRTIKPEANPLVMLRPFGPVAFVFELGDTEGKEPFPEALINPFKVVGEVSVKHFKNLTKYMNYDGIFYREGDHGTSSAGFIKTDKSQTEVAIMRNGKKVWIKVLYNIVVNGSLGIEEKFATVLHELGHAYCGHLGTPNEKWWIDRKHIDKYEMEFEAESICWLICERLGIKNPSAEYLSHHLKPDRTIPDISVDAVLKAVGFIENLLKGNKKPRKEVVR